MKRLPRLPLSTALLIALSLNLTPQSAPSVPASAYLGFDRNDYPGDANLKLLRQTFSYAGFWLNQPPGEKTNTWTGKRQAVQSAGFGFLVLFNGRLYSQLKTVLNAGRLGRSDAQAAVAARAARLSSGNDHLPGAGRSGRTLPQQQLTFIPGWTRSAPGFRACIYCSGIAAKEDGGASVITAEVSGSEFSGQENRLFGRERCLPAFAGMRFPQAPTHPQSGIDFAEVRQFAQSPKRRHVAARSPLTTTATATVTRRESTASGTGFGSEYRGQRRSFSRKGPLTGPTNLPHVPFWIFRIRSMTSCRIGL